MSIFKSYSREVEAAFGMFSVSLDEAISLHDNGFVAHSLQVSVLMSGLCKRFTDHLEDVLLSMEEHSTLHRTTPSVAALKFSRLPQSPGCTFCADKLPVAPCAVLAARTVS
jgi:hypothetical protein